MVEEVQIDDLAAPKQLENAEQQEESDEDDAITVTRKPKSQPIIEEEKSDTVAAGEAERNVN